MAGDRKLLDDERAKLKREREQLLGERLHVEEVANEVRREKENIDVERKTFESEKGKFEEFQE